MTLKTTQCPICGEPIIYNQWQAPDCDSCRNAEILVMVHKLDIEKAIESMGELDTPWLRRLKKLVMETI
jgi:hypothetical protein